MDKKGKSLRWLPYVAAPVIFLLVSMLYFAPQFSGEKLDMHDVTQYVGARAIRRRPPVDGQFLQRYALLHD